MDRPIKSNAYCPELWQRIFINQINDQWHAKPCCYAKPISTNSMMIADGRRIFEIYNSSREIQDLRQKNLQGSWDLGCEVCELNEKTMGHSGRTDALSQMSTDITESSYVDLNLGSLCNLACAICDPNSSTSWVPIYNRMNVQPWAGIKYKQKNRPIINDPQWFSKIKRLQLQGGEIFLQTNYLNFFENLAEHRDIGEIEIRIFTNGTVIPDPKLWKLLTQAGKVDLYFSIDDIKQRFEYQRHGADWTSVTENLKWFVDNAGERFQLGIHPTYSILNIWYLGELIEYFQTHFPMLDRTYGNYFVSAGPLSAHILPAGLRNLVIQRLSDYIELNFIADFIQPGADTVSMDMLDYIHRYDRATSKSYAQSHREFWDLIQEYRP